MGALVPMFIKAMRLDAGLNTTLVLKAWDEASGASAYTLNKFFRDGRLFVTVSSSMVRSHLEFQKADIVASINRILENDPLFSNGCAKAGFVKEIILK